MRILYGVVGEGMGHATRSRVVIEHLLAAGHDVEIAVSGRAHDMLAKHFPTVRKIHGLHMVYADNEVKKRKTAWSNLEALNEGLPHNVAAWFSMLNDQPPDVVISDFESLTWLYAKSQGLPVISIDNMQIINRCSHDEALIGPHDKAFRLAKAIVKSKLPGCKHYLISTFFHPPVRKERTTLVPPILRPEVIAAHAQVEEGDHVLVYQTGEGYEALLEVLAGFSEVPFLIYGMKRDLTEDVYDGNLTFRPFSETGFIEDLATAQAVIAGGGFSLMSEAVFLGKPMLSVPLAGQFEQILNGLYLEKLGYGLMRDAITREDVAVLLGRAPELAANLKAHVQDGNRALLGHLDDLLAALGA